jgi:hypothetical protein
MRRRRRHDLRPDRPRIFGIGLNKTGTTSFDAAMKILGFRSLHYGGPTVHDAVQRAIDDDAPLLSNLDEKYDAFSDIGLLSRRFRLLDDQYPGSRFVLTTRPVDDWIESRRRHVEFNRRRHESGRYGGDFLAVDEAGWREEWEHHLAGVRGYFAGRPDFLEIDLTAAPSWSPLCSVLDVPEPTRQFPEANQSTSRKVRRRWRSATP